MAKHSLNGVLKDLRKAAAVHTYRELADRDLLERFVSACDEAAFNVLVERHGPMVLGVCRRALPCFHDAQDACQATFLVLARKAGSVRKKSSLGSWLHGVACRVVARLKRDHARRTNRERGIDTPTQKDPAAEVSWREVQAILDEELEALPERFRAPVILCYLECLTRDEAAQQLGLSPGTLHGQLERARTMLRARLAKRGLTLAATMCAAALGTGASQAALDPAFVVSSTRAALLLATGKPLSESLVGTHVLALTQEVLKTMIVAKLKLGAAAAACVVLLAVVLGGSFASLSNAQAPTGAGLAPTGGGGTIRFTGVRAVKQETDAEFIRRISKDLRGTDPTPAEMHFFLANKDAGKRQKLIDLFIQERQANQKASQRDHVNKALNYLGEKQVDPNALQAWINEVGKGAEGSEKGALEQEEKRLRDLVERIKKAREELEKLKREEDSQKGKTGIDFMQDAALRERIDEEQRYSKEPKYPVPHPPTNLPVRGVVEKIDPNNPSLLSISIGSDADVAKDNTLDVYRLTPAPMYLGKIEIVEVTPHKAVARRVGVLSPPLLPKDVVSPRMTSPEQGK